jgi:hypothetical protein
VRDDSGVYAVTVRGNAGDQVVYVNSEGTIVQPWLYASMLTPTLYPAPRGIFKSMQQRGV